jgi:hypothetical protein
MTERKDYAAKLRSISDNFDGEADHIRNNPMLPPEGRRSKLKELAERTRKDWADAKAMTEGQMAKDAQELRRRANPRPTLKYGIHTMDTGAIVEELRRQELKRNITEQLKGNPALVVDMWNEAADLGDEETIRILADIGPRYARGDDKDVLQEGIDQLYPDRKAARQELADLQQQQDQVGHSIALMEQTFMARTNVDGSGS